MLSLSFNISTAIENVRFCDHIYSIYHAWVRVDFDVSQYDWPYFGYYSNVCFVKNPIIECLPEEVDKFTLKEEMRNGFLIFTTKRAG